MSSEAKSRESVLLDPIDDILNELIVYLLFLLDLWIDIIYAPKILSNYKTTTVCWDPYKQTLNRPKFSETVTVSALAGNL
ncbi:hypothetical protein BpHYR1_040534 [Brachionus plicatilis]|uniref:Uncharacterized protein n=1 Tax=Brachionus plicatilis TaxID=10195 RepID=A0A3M7PEV2_BRAPC|nr:hypothetical protein BpHYR1_040534 [Brachionus plicatilis]